MNGRDGICFLFDVPMCALCGGVERVSCNLTPPLEKSGLRVRYLSRLPNNPDNPQPVDEARQFFLPDARRFARPRNFEFFEKFLRRERIGFVLWQHGLDKKFPYAEICRRLDVRVVTCIHSSIFGRRSRFASEGNMTLKKRLKLLFHEAKSRSVWSFNLKKTDATTLLASRDADALRKMFPDRAEKVFFLPNPTTFPADASRVALSEKKPEILFVGRLSMTDKRPDYLLRIWKRIEKHFPEWTLRIVGSGGDEARLKSLAAELGLERVSFEGFRAPAPYYHDAAVFCLTSAFEGLPMAMLEAMQFGCVPVAFGSFNSVHDLVADGESGFIVPPFDCDAYAERLSRVMSNDALR